METNKQYKKLIIRGKAAVFIDWANVHGWSKKLGWEVSAYKLVEYFRTYQEITKINFYFGTDINLKSKNFINSMSKLQDGIFNVITKKVKYVPVELVSYNEELFSTGNGRRKCDFDVEITRDALNNANNFEIFILISGDGDYAPLIDDLINKGKKAILIFAPGCKGKEYGDFKKGLFLCSINKIKEFVVK